MLAFACAFTMFAGAAFTDQADINADNVEAVDLLTTLGIIKGYEDGSFDPEGTVDRAEMAKMIYTIRNGGNDNASAHVGNTTSFTDISGHWAEGYIKYLQNTGIVAGKSATQFAPDAQVTTAEAMKMALALAGYDEKNAGLTGIDWQKNTLTYATTIGLTDDVNSAMSAGCSRQDAAQILANVLEATAVRYSAIVENFVNDSKTGLSYGGAPITVGYKWMDLTIYIGRMVSSGEMNIADAGNAGKDRFSVVVDTANGIDIDSWNWNWTYWNGAYNEKDRTLTLKDGQDHTDLVGQEVKVLTGDKADEVYGVYATGTSNVVETTMSQVDYDDDGLKIDGVVYDCVKDSEDETAVYADNEAKTTVNAVFSENHADVQKVADRVKLIDWDNDDDYETIIVKTVNVAKVSSVTSKSISLGAVGSRVDDRTLANNSTLDFDDNTIYEGVAKGDYAIVTRNLYNDDWIVEKAETVSGTVNGKVDNERRVRVDGEWYTLANENDAKPGTLLTISGSRSSFENDDNISLVVVDGIAYYAESTTGNDANRAVLMVYDTNWEGGEWEDTPQAKVILADGTKKTVDIDKVDGNLTHTPDGEKIDLDIGRMYRYTVDNDGDYTLYTLTNANDTSKVGYEEVNDNTAGIVNDRVDGTAIADEAVVFVLIGDNDADVYSGKTIKDANVYDGWGTTRNGQYLTDTENGFTYARMLNVAIDSDDELSQATSYGYLTSDATRTKINGVNYMEYNFWDGDNNVFALEKTDNDRREEAKEGAIISFAYTGGTVVRAENDGSAVEITDVAVNDEVVFAAMTGANSSSVQLRSNTMGGQTYDVTSDTEIFYVDSHANNPEDIGQTDKEGFDFVVGLNKDEKTYPVNVAYVIDNDENELDLLVIDVENDMKGQSPVKANETGVKEISGSDENLVAEINNAEDRGSIVVTGSAAINGAIDPTVPVTFNGDLTVGKDGDIGGDVTVKGTLAMNGGKISGDVVANKVAADATGTVTGTLTVANPNNGELAGLTGTGNAKIVLNDNYTAGASDKFYADASTQIADNATVPAGTYTWNSTVGVGGGWVASKVESMTVTMANLATALAMTDNVTVTDGDAPTDSIVIEDGQTVTFNVKVTTSTTKAITVNEGGKAIFKDGVDVQGTGMLAINGEAEVTGALTRADGKNFTGTGKLTVHGAQNAGMLECASDCNGMILVLDTQTTNNVRENRWDIGGYTDADIKAPAGTYVSDGSKWVLESITDSEIVAGEIANEAMLSALFSVTDRVEAAGVADNQNVNVTNDKTLALSDNPGTGARVRIAARGVVELNGDVAWYLARFVGLGEGATVKFGALTTDPDNISVTEYFWNGGVHVTTSIQAANTTFVYDLNAGGSGVPGFVAQ